MNNQKFAISVNGLSKMYKIYRKPSDMLKEIVLRKQYSQEFWALRDVSFDVKMGEVVGVIGRNGAGKSTLLRILAGTLDKTSGQVQVNGKISAILELGTGFHPEYTGRENIVMGGLTLGMSQSEIKRKLQSIIDFSELWDFIDQPFRTYSTGMQARLTFATAISIEPDIFIVDEALAVGDMYFQQKCFNKIREIASSGSTVLFVTHSLGTIYEFCTRAILLEQKVIANDIPRKVGYAYEKLLEETAAKQARHVVMAYGAESTQDRSDANKSEFHAAEKLLSEEAIEPSAFASAPNEDVAQERQPTAGMDIPKSDNVDAQIKDIAILNDDGTKVSNLYYGEMYTLRISCLCNIDCPSLTIGARVVTATGLGIYATNTTLSGIEVCGKTGEVLELTWRFCCQLHQGQYMIGAGVSHKINETTFNLIHFLVDGYAFFVVDQGPFSGYVNLDWELKPIVKTKENLGA